MTAIWTQLATTSAQPSPMPSFVLMLIIFGIFYFIVFAPMRKRQRELQQVIDSLEKGDRVVTTGGIHGEVAGLEGNIVFLKVADKVKLKVAKSAIAGREQQESKS